MNRSWLYGGQGQGTNIDSVYDTQALSSSYISTNTTFIWTPTVAHKAASPKSTYKSLPALDKHFDQVDTELQTLSDSVDVLYQQEDKEIDFLENFIDYDSISIVCNENMNDIRTNNPEIAKGMQDFKSEGLPPIMANEKEKRKSRKDKIRERLRWLTSRSKLTMRNFGSRDNLQNMREGLQKSKERLGSALSPARSRRGSYEWSVRLNNEGHNVRDSIIVMDGGEGNLGEEVIKNESKIEIKSFQVPVLKVNENDTKRKPKFTKYNKSKKGKNPKMKEESVKPLEDLEKLERLVLRDSVRETLQKRREMGPINEELDLAFNNLSYDAVNISDASRDARKYYENVDPAKSNTDRMYENVQTDYENALVSNQHYENFPNQESHKMKAPADEDYENYDFGESGVYQNILYDKSANAIIVTDLSSQVHTLRKSVNEVNQIVEESKSNKEDESQPLKRFQSKMNIQLKLPIVNGTKQGDNKIQVTDTNSLDRKPLNDENEQKSEAKLKPSTLKKPTNSIFRKWALSKAEHPKIDLAKLKENSSLDVSRSTFTEREKEIVAQFLKDVKGDLQ